jgi:plasmid stability protein
MERFTVEIPDDTAAQLREAAEAHGRTFEEELVQRASRDLANERAARIRAMSGADFVQHLIDTAGGMGMDLPERHNIPEDRDVFGAD